MNEPRSQAELYIVVRETTDGSKQYNISYNPANDLQTWIEDTATYVKSLDPIHLLCTGLLVIYSCPTLIDMIPANSGRARALINQKKLPTQ